jgi:hypothetical protein
MPDLFMILDDLGRNVAALRESLSPLRALAGKDGPFPMAAKPARRAARRGKARRSAAAAPAKRKATIAPRPRRKFSPKGRAALKMAGRYMGLVRNLTAAQKAKVKKARETNDIGAAIEMAAGMRKRS